MKSLFIVNSGSGGSEKDWAAIISDYFGLLDVDFEVYLLPRDFSIKTIDEKIKASLPQKVIAVGGDGTIKAVATCLINRDIPLGILPSGTANGLAREIGIPTDPEKALDIIVEGSVKHIHLTRINDEYCIHLSDIGLNALAIKEVKLLHVNGLWGYAVASIKSLRKNPLMNVDIQIEDKTITLSAVIIVIANATRYATGAVINPIGRLDDALFEVIVVKKISLIEILKMIFFHTRYNSAKTEIFQTTALTMHSAKKVHFQVDGEYMGMTNDLKASILPSAIQLIVPSAH